MQKANGNGKIVASFSVFMLMFVINLFVPVSGKMSYTSRMWLILDVCVFAVSVALLLKYELLAKKYIILSLILGSLMFVAYQRVSFSSFKGFVTTALCSVASFSVFGSCPAHAVFPVKSPHFKSVLLSLVTGFAAGCILGAVNLMLSGQPLNFNFNISCLLLSLSPGILEEVCYRLLIFAFCLHLLGGEIKSKTENFQCYFMMVIPHVLIHTPDIFLNYGIISGLVNIVMLSLIFGLPFAVMQRKRDLTSAMVAHGTVDLIRFSFLGLPY